MEDSHITMSPEEKFRKEQQEFNAEKKPQEQPDLHKVEHLEVLDL